MVRNSGGLRRESEIGNVGRGIKKEVIEVVLTEIVGIEMEIGLVELAEEEEEAEEALEKVEDLMHHTTAAQTKGATQISLVAIGRWQRGWALVYKFPLSSMGSDLFFSFFECSISVVGLLR